MIKFGPVRGHAIGALSALLVLGACAGDAGSETSDGAASAVPPEIVMDGERLFPESITSDAAGNIYIGSNPGAIYRAEPGSETADVWIAPDEANGLQTVFGVLADDTRGLLWACSNPNMSAGSPPAAGPAIKTFSLADGSLQETYAFPADIGPAMCNDMTIAANGDVYASEMLGGRIMRLPAGADGWEVFAADEEFTTVDGIAFAEDGTLYVNAIQRNSLVRVNVDEHGAFTNATVLNLSREIAGPDGLRLLNGHRFLQSEGNSGLITVVTIDGDNALIETIAQGIDYASSVTEVNGRAFYPEGKLSFMFDPNKQMQDPGPFIVRNAAIPEAE